MEMIHRVNLAAGEALPRNLPMRACWWLETVGRVSSLEIWKIGSATELRAVVGTREVGVYTI